MKIFTYDNVNDEIVLNDTNILLVKEFAILYGCDRNKTKEDKKGDKKILAFKEFKYMYLFLD